MIKETPFKNQVDKLMKKASREITYQSLADSIKVSRMHLWRLLNADSLTAEQKETILKQLK